MHVNIIRSQIRSQAMLRILARAACFASIEPFLTVNPALLTRVSAMCTAGCHQHPALPSIVHLLSSSGPASKCLFRDLCQIRSIRRTSHVAIGGNRTRRSSQRLHFNSQHVWYRRACRKLYRVPTEYSTPKPPRPSVAWGKKHAPELMATNGYCCELRHALRHV